MSFPADTVKKAIMNELQSITAEAIQRHEQPTDASWEPEVDSQSVIRIILRIEEETGLSLPEECVPVGGFNDTNHCIESMITHAKAAWVEQEKAKEMVTL